MAVDRRQWIAAVAMVLGLCATVRVVARNPGPSATSTSTASTKTGRPGSADDGRPVPPRKGNPVEDRKVGEVDGGHWLSEWQRPLGALVLVVALVLGARYLLGRTGRFSKVVAGQQVIEVLARCNLSLKHQLCLIRLGERILLVGSGPEGLVTLTEVTDAEEASRLLADVGAAKSAGLRDPSARRPSGMVWSREGEDGRAGRKGRATRGDEADEQSLDQEERDGP